MSFLTGYVLGMTLNKSPNRSYHKRDFEKEQLKIKCQELEQQVQRLQEQLNEANELLKISGYGSKENIYPFPYVCPEECRNYLKKWGVK